MARPPKHPVDVKLKIVLSVLSGEPTQAEVARRHGISETSIGKWKEQFLLGGARAWSTMPARRSRSAARPAWPTRSMTSRGPWARLASSCERSSAAAPGRDGVSLSSSSSASKAA